MFKSLLLLSCLCLLSNTNLLSQGKVSLSLKLEQQVNINLQRTENHLIPNFKNIPIVIRKDNATLNITAQIDKADYYQLVINGINYGIHLQPTYQYNVDLLKNEIIIHSGDGLNQILAFQKQLINDISEKYRGLFGRTKKGYENALLSIEQEVEKEAKSYDLTEYAYQTIQFSLMTIKARDIASAKEFQAFMIEEIYPIMDLTNKEFVENAANILISKANSGNIRESTVPFRPNETLAVIDEANYFDQTIFQQFALLQYLNICLNGTFLFEPDRELIDSTLKKIIIDPLTPTISIMANALAAKIITLKRGNPIVDFAINFYKEDSTHLSDLQGKIVVLDFWYTGCKPCLEAVPQIKTLIANHEKDLKFISIDPVDTEERFLKMVKKKGMNWPHVLTTEDNAMSQYFNVVSYPTYIIIDQEGKFYGDYSSKDFFEAINSLL